MNLSPVGQLLLADAQPLSLGAHALSEDLAEG